MARQAARQFPESLPGNWIATACMVVGVVHADAHYMMRFIIIALGAAVGLGTRRLTAMPAFQW